MPTTSEETSSLAGTSVVVHPLVLLSVTDHASRAGVGRGKRVVGVLLGQDNGKTINVANSFAVPFEEDDRDGKTWFLDHDYIEGMMEMFKKVNAREKMIGWYHTGPKLRSSDLDIDKLMKRFTPRSTMVIIDPNRQDVGLPTDAYLAVEEIKDDGTATQKTFMHIPTTVEAEEAEEVGVEHLLRDIYDTTAVGSLSERVSSQLGALSGLYRRLIEIREYLEAVVSGDLPVNHEIVYELQNIFNYLPDLDKPETVCSFRVANNDRLLIVYLSSLIRAVIALHGLVNNRLEMARSESNAQTDSKESSKDSKDSKSKDGDQSKETQDANPS
ncbi:proteasome regulatory particle subunit [Malassezia yamatoensis]|uniref:Proteasome regulatory particle subunit n=1 Tax=Malassezia yamatoensis TaxID=253288 RepID=A0AAJ6CG82_9BASI|nr:proteasome regulatory particle subunit [Malassezia yamatoensis]